MAVAGQRGVAVAGRDRGRGRPEWRPWQAGALDAGGGGREAPPTLQHQETLVQPGVPGAGEVADVAAAAAAAAATAPKSGWHKKPFSSFLKPRPRRKLGEKSKKIPRDQKSFRAKEKRGKRKTRKNELGCCEKWLLCRRERGGGGDQKQASVTHHRVPAGGGTWQAGSRENPE